MSRRMIPDELACRLQACVQRPNRRSRPKPIKWATRKSSGFRTPIPTSTRQGNFTLRYITPHSYFWVEDGTDVNEDDMKQLMDTFEKQDLSNRPRILRQ